MTQAAEDLQKATDILDARGWCQGAYMNDDGNICLSGALWQAVGAVVVAQSVHSYTEEMRDRYICTASFLVDASRNGFGIADAAGLPGFNDKVASSVEDVKLLLKKAIDLAEEA